MGRSTRLAKALLLPLPLFASASANALQTLEVKDGVAVEAVLSQRELTRIRIDGSGITSVFGNIYSSNCGAAATAPAGAPLPPGAPPVAGMPAGGAAVNTAGEIVLECDTDKGEIYVRPVPSLGKKPVNLFVSSAHATYTLLLRPADTPADTIVLRDRSMRERLRASERGLEPAESSGESQHERDLKAMTLAMNASRLPGEFQDETVYRDVALWVEARFTLRRIVTGRGFIGEVYTLENVSNNDMVLAAHEFDREDGSVVAVSVEHHNLRPGDVTNVYVIRRGT